MMSPQSLYPENVLHCRLAILTLLVLILLPLQQASLFVHTFPTTNHRKFTLKPSFVELHKYNNYSTTRRNQQRSDDGSNGGLEEEAAKLRRKAEELRSQIRDMENKLGNDRRPFPSSQQLPPLDTDNSDGKKSLKNKRILIVGANGRLGSMVTRHLLRSHPEVKEVVAAVHYVGQASTIGYGRLSYEVGAEDGKGTIGPAWDEESNASFVFDPRVMSNYNINKLRIVEVELLNPTQVRTIIDNVDSIIFCATDFDGNRPRSIASLNAALLFRAVADPTKGRVEIEGLRNCLEGLVADVNDRRWQEERRRSNEPGATIVPSTITKNGMPTQFVLISTSPDAYGSFDTPYGEFNGLKRQGERLFMEDFPSITYTVLQMGKYDDNFVSEGQELQYEMAIEDTVVVDGVVNAIKIGGGGTIVKDGMQKRINRRDAARAAVEALLSEDIEGKKVQVYTALRKNVIW